MLDIEYIKKQFEKEFEITDIIMKTLINLQAAPLGIVMIANMSGTAKFSEVIWFILILETWWVIIIFAEKNSKLERYVRKCIHIIYPIVNSVIFLILLFFIVKIFSNIK